MRKNNQEIALENYLEVEALLREFFDNVDYCKDNCITQKFSLHPNSCRGDVGCCTDEYHESSSGDVNFLLKKNRTERYGYPENQEEPWDENGSKPCRYHTKEEGCILEDHRTPICNAWICDPQSKYLYDTFGIKYYISTIGHKLKKVLENKLSNPELSQFKSTIKDFTKKVKVRNERKKLRKLWVEKTES